MFTTPNFDCYCSLSYESVFLSKASVADFAFVYEKLHVSIFGEGEIKRKRKKEKEKTIETSFMSQCVTNTRVIERYMTKSIVLR